MPSSTVQQLSCARIPTDSGEFQLCLYRADDEDDDHLALVMGDVTEAEEVLVRVHSECFTGDVLGSKRCDCGQQLLASINRVATAGQGVILYLRQEGRGIGLLDKLRAYNLQDRGFDTVEANLLLGHEPDVRDYRVAAAILKDLKVRSIQLLTNNPNKIEQLQEYGTLVKARVPLEIAANEENESYLRTKSLRLNHLLNMGGGQDGRGFQTTDRTNGRSP